MHTNEERLPREAYGEAGQCSFEGRTLCAPHDTDRYLKQLYGDYMKLPPEEKRIRHHHCTVFAKKGANA